MTKESPYKYPIKNKVYILAYLKLEHVFVGFIFISIEQELRWLYLRPDLNRGCIYKSPVSVDHPLSLGSLFKRTCIPLFPNHTLDRQNYLQLRAPYIVTRLNYITMAQKKCFILFFSSRLKHIKYVSGRWIE